MMNRQKEKASKQSQGVLLWCSRLRIQHCHYNGPGHCCCAGSNLGQEFPHATSAEKKKKKKKKTIKKKKKPKKKKNKESEIPIL